MNILGISAFYHDSAAALVRDGELVAAAQEERFTRKKHDAALPEHAIAYCLRAGDVGSGEIDAVVYYDKPITTFVRLLKTYLRVGPKGFARSRRRCRCGCARSSGSRTRSSGGCATSATRCRRTSGSPSTTRATPPAPSSRRRSSAAAILTFDGVGEWATSSIGVGEGNRIELQRQLNFPNSLGLLYSAFTYFCGFRVNSGEYKLMGLAPYGEPRYADTIRENCIDLREDGSFRMDMRYFDFLCGLTMTNRRFDELFGGPAREPECEITRREMDLARSIQVVTEEIVLRWRATPHRSPASATRAWPAASRSTASPTVGCCARGRSSGSGSSPRRSRSPGRIKKAPLSPQKTAHSAAQPDRRSVGRH